jgi:vacuolar-type H+-ATPase subunit E/Vma4
MIMKKETYTEIAQANRENAQEICAKIRHDADAEAGDILSRARKEAENILAEGRAQSEQKSRLLFAEQARHAEKIQEKIFSTLAMEKKRIALEEKNIFLRNVLDRVRRLAEAFRRSKEYEDFLAAAVLEGVLVIDTEAVDVSFSKNDEKIFTDAFARKVEALCNEKTGRHVSLSFKGADFQDIGVTVLSRDGRLSYDNRFASRLARVYDDIYMGLLRGAFSCKK